MLYCRHATCMADVPVVVCLCDTYISHIHSIECKLLYVFRDMFVSWYDVCNFLFISTSAGQTDPVRSQTAVDNPSDQRVLMQYEGF